MRKRDMDLESRFSSRTYFLKINSSTLLSFTRKCTALQSINLDPTRDHRRDRAVAPRVMARVGKLERRTKLPARDRNTLLAMPFRYNIYSEVVQKRFHEIVAYFRGKNGRYVIYIYTGYPLQ